MPEMSSSVHESAGDGTKLLEGTLPPASLLALKTDVELLRSGDHADFTIHCGDRKWLVHKSILTRCPYYETMLKKDRDWKEKAESASFIKGFEPFEVNWLVRYLYHTVLDPEILKHDLPSKSHLEVCVRLQTLGDYFSLPLLTNKANEQLQSRANLHLSKFSNHYNAIVGIPFMDELDAAIRLAWAPGYIDGPFRKPLLELFLGVLPCLHKHPSCSKLLDEVSGFGVDLVKAKIATYV